MCVNFLKSGFAPFSNKAYFCTCNSIPSSIFKVYYVKCRAGNISSRLLQVYDFAVNLKKDRL